MSRVLLIGLDSADADLIEQWCEEGRLPTLARLRRDGVWGRLGTTAEVMHVSAWPSIYTGTTPGHHGMYHAYQVRAGEQTAQRTRPEWCARPPFWKFLDDAGRKCIVMDAFMNHPLEHFRGIEILEYGTWTWFGQPAASPPAMREVILRRFGAYPSPEHSLIVSVPDISWFRDRLGAGAEVKARVVNWLLAEHPWDMAFVTFGEPHGAGHYLWHVGDASYPTHPPTVEPRLAHPLCDVYEAVDRAIGDILGRIEDDVTVLLISGDGMGPNYAGAQLLPGALHRLGLFHSTNAGDGADARPRKGFLASIRSAIPLSIRQSVTRCLPRSVQHRLSLKWASAGINWQRSRVSCIPNANEGYLRVNLRGREPAGIVEPGTGCAQLLADLAAEMRGLRNPANGLAAADQVFLIDEVFPGSERRHLPDLVVAWDPGAQLLTEMVTPNVGKVVGPAAHQTAPFYTGNHRPNAFVLARGPGIRAGERLERGHIVDLAPTVLALLGVDPPPHFEGSAWPGFS